LQQLFKAEKLRFEHLIERLKEVTKTYGEGADLIWLSEEAAADNADFELGILARSDVVDTITDRLRKPVSQLMRREDVSLEVHGWSPADLEALDWAPITHPSHLVPLYGVLPHVGKATPRSRRASRRSHADADEALRRRAELIAEEIAQRPELVRKAREEVVKRLKTAPPPEARTLREWEDILSSMSVPRLRKWLVGRGERATRLRQSLPLTLLLASKEHGTAHGDDE